MGRIILLLLILSIECERFKLKELIPDMFKCLIFVQELTAWEDGEIRKRISSKVEKSLKEEFERIENLGQGTARTEEYDM